MNLLSNAHGCRLLGALTTILAGTGLYAQETDLRHIGLMWDGTLETSVTELGQSLTFDSLGSVWIGLPAGNRVGRYVNGPSSWFYESPVAGDSRYGESVAFEGTWLAIGAPAQDIGGSAQAGAVHVRSTIQSSLFFSLQASDATAMDHFGSALSISQESILVGAPKTGRDVGSAYVFVDPAAGWAEQAKLTAPDATDGDLFGTTVAIAGDTAFVGAPGDDTTMGIDAGSVYVFERSGSIWSFQERLEAADAVAGAGFGSALSADSDSLVVGAPRHDDGRAYVFVRSGTSWVQERQFLPEAHGAAAFGSSVAIDGDLAAVGAPTEDSGVQPTVGAAYVYRREQDGWTRWKRLVSPSIPVQSLVHDPYGFGTSVAVSEIEGRVAVGAPGGNHAHLFTESTFATVSEEALLIPDDGQPQDRFGFQVAADNALLVASSPWHDHPGAVDAGSVYVFRRRATGWTQEASLTSSPPVAESDFGTALDIDETTVLVGAPLDDELGLDAGAAYVFTKHAGSWVQETKLVAPDGRERDNFGSSVSVFGDTAVVGAPKEDNLSGNNAGAVYVFQRSGTQWLFTHKLRASDGDETHQFGNAVSVSDDTLAIGAWRANWVGRAYVFRRQGTDWVEEAILPRTAPDRQIGSSVSVDGDIVAVGAPNSGITEPSSISVFRRAGSAWQLERRIALSGGDGFGLWVEVVGERFASSSFRSEIPAGTPGGLSFLYALGEGSWQLDRRFRITAPENQESSGFVGALTEDTLFVGSPNASVGAVYVYDVGEPFASFCDASDLSGAACPCDNPGAGEAGCDLSQETGGVRLDFVKRSTTPLNRATAVALGFPTMGGPSATFLRSPSILPDGPVVFGDGTLCLQSPLVRVGASVASGGTLTHVIGHGTMAGSGVFHYQLHLRNTPVLFCDPTAGFNLSNGRSITW